jgi:hypothetical protein
MALLSQSVAFSLKIGGLMSLPTLIRYSSFVIACFPLVAGGFNCVLYRRYLQCPSLPYVEHWYLSQLVEHWYLDPSAELHADAPG